MNYYQFHIGDYRRDTGHLSIIEHGVYRQLLDQYYMTEQPIAPMDAKLMRSLCIRNADEKQALENVLNDFFVSTENGYIHKRCDIDIAEFHSKSDSAREAANFRWAKARALLDANALQSHSVGIANVSVLDANAQKSDAPSMPTMNHKPLTVNQPSDEGFDSVYQAYPKKVGKPAALKAWKAQHIKPEQVQFILNDIAKRKNSRDWQKDEGQFIPNPATYLNQRRWEDAPLQVVSVMRGVI